MRKYAVLIFLIYSSCLLAKGNSLDTLKPFVFSAYLEPYYGYDFRDPQNNARPSFLYSYAKQNQFSINLGFVKASITKTNWRANAALAVGTYMKDNLAAEPNWLNNIFELNIGWKVPQKNIWIDAGVFPSHIGFESAIGKDNYVLSRSIMAENSPYYETGIKASFQSTNQKINFSFLLLNGWQKMYRTDKSNHLALGHQLQYQVNKRLLLNSSSFVGLANRDSIMLMRYFHNAYGIYELSPSWQFIAGFDMGIQEKKDQRNAYDLWHTVVLMSRYKLNDKNTVSFRFEYYQDRDYVLVNLNMPGGFSTSGFSGNYDLQLAKHIVWRNELRCFWGLKNYAALSAVSIWF
jgi:hypothetical protein